ncbi:DUF2971 domain-containing protein [Terrarubrum flagellatum]|uniref:DUF2971 domain-containing protein n=1 Tax=Terrirubrum flagellatum TaxID=2895980 RepID=UPI0031450F82
MANQIPHFYEVHDHQLLYHYTSVSGALAILKSRKFWLSEYSKTNDSSEYTYSRENYVRAYQNRQVYIDDVPRLAATTALVGSETNASMFIGCFTENRDDLGQWRSYADNGRGCVIGIDPRYLRDEAGVAIKRIVYSEIDLDRFVNIGLSMLQDHYCAGPNDRRELSSLATYFVADLFAFKHPAFVAENEIRVSRMLVVDESEKYGLRDVGGRTASGNRVDALDVKMRPGLFGDTRYIELPLSVGHCGSAIKSIGLGPACSTSVEAEIQDMNRSLPEPLQVWRSPIPYRI